MTTSGERVLVVGAGAVGQVYGRHLQMGGAEVTFLVKPKHIEKLSEPLPLYPLNAQKVTEPPVLWCDYAICSDVASIEPGAFDQVWLCVSSTALRTGWFPKLAECLGEGTLISLLPGLEDRAFLLRYVPESQLVMGLINLISYETPLRGELVDTPGIAYWFPPMGATPLSGPRERRDGAISTLRAGGQPARKHSDVAAMSGFPTAVLMPLLLGLEACDWSFVDFTQSQDALRSIRGVKEALAIVAAYQSRSIPWWGATVRRGSLRALLALVPKALPLPLETYLEHHFTKVGDQTRFFVDTYIRLGAEKGLPNDALIALREQVDHVVALKR